MGMLHWQKCWVPDGSGCTVEVYKMEDPEERVTVLKGVGSR